MSVPRQWVEQGLEKAKGAKFFGVPIEQLTRDELTAMAMKGWEEYEEANERNTKATLELFRSRLRSPQNIAIVY